MPPPSPRGRGTVLKSFPVPLGRGWREAPGEGRRIALCGDGDLFSQADTFDLFDQSCALEIQELGGEFLVAVRLSEALKDQFALHVGDNVLKIDTFFRNFNERNE